MHAGGYARNINAPQMRGVHGRNPSLAHGVLATEDLLHERIASVQAPHGRGCHQARDIAADARVRPTVEHVGRDSAASASLHGRYAKLRSALARRRH